MSNYNNESLIELEAENCSLRDRVEEVEADNAALRAEVETLRKQNDAIWSHKMPPVEGAPDPAEIDRLRAKLTYVLRERDATFALVVQQRDEARAEVEALTTLLTANEKQECDEIARLRAEVERLTRELAEAQKLIAEWNQPVPQSEWQQKCAEVEALQGALRSAKPVYTTHKNSAAVRSGHVMSGAVKHYIIEPHVLHAALAAGRE